jgi:nucleoside-diphosphate-sugar epimerase
VINFGGNDPYKLNYVIKLIEKYLDKKAKINNLPFHKADIMATWADVGEAKKILNWKSEIRLEEGIKRTVAWYIKNRAWLKEIQI